MKKVVKRNGDTIILIFFKIIFSLIRKSFRLGLISMDKSIPFTFRQAVLFSSHPLSKRWLPQSYISISAEYPGGLCGCEIYKQRTELTEEHKRAAVDLVVIP